MFKVEKKDESFIVAPTAEYLASVFDRLSFPYDSNWEIYKLYNYCPKDLFQYLTVKFNAHVILKEDFPYVKIYFDKEIDALNFKEELENRVIIQKNFSV